MCFSSIILYFEVYCIDTCTLFIKHKFILIVLDKYYDIELPCKLYLELIGLHYLLTNVFEIAYNLSFILLFNIHLYRYNLEPNYLLIKFCYVICCKLSFD